MPGVLIREAPMSRETFMRHLELALDGKTYTSAVNDEIIVEGGRIIIRLTDKQQDTGATVLLADFSFDTMPDDEIRAFMERFDRAAQDQAPVGRRA